jgi:cystathionine beta-lyase
MAGLKMGNIIIRDEDMRKSFEYRSKSQCGIVPNNPISIVAITAAYKYADAWLDNVRDYIWSNYEYLDSYLKKNIPSLKLTEPEATYLAWVDFSHTGLTGLTLRKFLREKARVALDEGMIFGKGSEGYARINVATDRTVLQEFLDRIRTNLIL